MSIKKYLETLPAHTIAKRVPFDRNTCVFFTGSLRKHPFDPNKLLLLSSPLTSHTEFLEFSIVDVAGVEEAPNLASDSGESVSMVKLWVRKGSFGLQYRPFEVDSPLRFMKDTDIIRYRPISANGDASN